MQKWLLTIIIAILPVITACSKTDTEVSVPEEETGKKTEIKFLQLNLWVECTKVEHAPEYLIEQIATLQPDIATFCELYKGPQDDPVMPKLMQGLKDKGLIYYDARIDGRAVISKYPIKASTNGCSKRFWMSMGNEWPFTRHIQSIVTTPVTIPGDTMTVALIGINFRLLSLM